MNFEATFISNDGNREISENLHAADWEAALNQAKDFVSSEWILTHLRLVLDFSFPVNKQTSLYPGQLINSIYWVWAIAREINVIPNTPSELILLGVLDQLCIMQH